MDSILVSIKEIKEFIVIYVKDTGSGIPKKIQNLVFNKFYQVNNSLSRPAEGTGLGLSIVKKIIQMHNGDISLKSKSGVGSEFIIQLPIKKKNDKNKKNMSNYKSTIFDRVDMEFSDIYTY